MISFKQFLHENEYKQSVDAKEALEILRTKCTDALLHLDAPLWRGFKGAQGDFMVVNSEVVGRQSRNTTNYYTIILDHTLKGTDFPLRSKSIICANNENKGYARGFGTRYAVIPFNNAKMGLAPSYDFWETNVKMFGRSHRIETLNMYYKRLGLSANSWDEFKQSVLAQSVDRIRQEFSALTHFTGTQQDLIHEIESAYTPEVMNIVATTPAKFNYSDHKDREVWVQGSCLCIQEDAFHNLQKQLAAE